MRKLRKKREKYSLLSALPLAMLNVKMGIKVFVNFAHYLAFGILVWCTKIAVNLFFSFTIGRALIDALSSLGSHRVLISAIDFIFKSINF